jgi:LacI family transcriptional regulator
MYQNVLGNSMRPTIRDIAKQLHLSITTVSRALDGYGDVAVETRRLVVEAAREMGYSPNRAARQLRRQRADTIGYIIPSKEPGFADPFYAEFIAGLGDAASANNFDLLVTTAALAGEAEASLYQRWIQSGKVDGMVVNRVQIDDWRLRFLAERGVPHVSLERSESQPDFVGVEVDSRGGLLELMAHLTTQGHSRIAYIGGPAEQKIDAARYAGYRSGLEAARIAPDPALTVRADLTPEGGFQAADRLLMLPTPPTAMVCVNDLTAIGAMHAAHQHGLKVGRDIAITGFDGIADAAHTQPPLTTLDQPVYSIARRLVTMLLALINGQPLPERQVRIVPRLLIRESSGS